MQTFSLEGEVVEIREELDHRLAKIVFTNPILLDVTGGGPPEIHLGDRVLVHGVMGVEREAL
jgi:hypothetical protein